MPPPRRPRRRRPRPVVDRGPQPIADALDTVMAGLVPRPARPGRPSRPGASDHDAGDHDAGDRGPGAGGDVHIPSAAAWGTVFSRWEELVGPSLARHARPLRLESGVLLVAVDLPPWATQVRALAPGILARLAEQSGEQLERLEVVVRPLA